MLALARSGICYRTIGRGVFHCERCGGDRPYRHRLSRRVTRLLGLSIASLGATGEHLRCTNCRTWYRVELLAVPTLEQMRVALLAGTKAAVVAMLQAGGADSPAARRRAIEMVRAAGELDYHDGRLLEDMAGSGSHGSGSAIPGAGGTVLGLRPALEAFAVQLEVRARGWFLAKVVEVGLADGALSAAERAVAGTVARYLGMTPAQGRNVVSLTEEAAQA
jgi:tellurite resistance protein